MKLTKSSPKSDKNVTKEKTKSKKTYYAVIDTNVLVSALFGKNSNPGWIVERVRVGVIIPLLGEEILKEYNEVLFRNKFPFKKRDIDKMIQLFVDKGIMLDRTKTDELFTNQDDIVFYEIVMTGRKTYDAYLVTGNGRHYPNKSYVVNPAKMKEIIEKDRVA